MPPIKGRMFNQRPAMHPMYSFKSAFSGRSKNNKPKAVATTNNESAANISAFNTFEGNSRTVCEPSTVVILDDEEEITPASSSSSSLREMLIRTKRTPTERHQYCAKQLLEVKFNAMIWDVAFLPCGNIVVSHANGASICNDQLEIKQALDNVRLGGGVATFTDGRIAVICRFNDTVNLFSPSGTYQKSFPVKGGNPASVAVNSRNELFVCDIGKKCVHIFNDLGAVLGTIPTSVDKLYALQWPEYILALADDSVLVCDVHQQCVLRFTADGKFAERLNLRTYENQQLLRPTGLCQGLASAFYVVDGATECVEAFTNRNNGVKLRHLQTIFSLATAEEARQLRMKVVRVDTAKRLMLIGGLTGAVRLLRLVKFAPPPPIPSTPAAAPAAGSFSGSSLDRAAGIKSNANSHSNVQPTTPSATVDRNDDVIVLD